MLIAYQPEVLSGFGDQLNALLSNEYTEVRNAAAQVLVVSGSPLDALAQQDKAALLAALEALPAGAAPPSTLVQVQALVEAGSIDAAYGIEQVVNLSADNDALFEWLGTLAEPARGVGFDQWGPSHTIAMAAMRGMSLVDDADWPEGYNDYRIARADPDIYELGRELYDIEEGGCIKCHGHNGEGLEGFPALVNSPWILGDPHRPAAIAEYGLTGSLTMHNGESFNSTMDPLGAGLDTTRVAAILTYIRQSWGNYAAPVAPGDVTRLLKPAGDEPVLNVDAVLTKYPLAYDTLFGEAPMPPVITIAGWHEPAGGIFLMLAAVAGLNGLILLATIAGARTPI